MCRVSSEGFGENFYFSTPCIDTCTDTCINWNGQNSTRKLSLGKMHSCIDTCLLCINTSLWIDTCINTCIDWKGWKPNQKLPWEKSFFESIHDLYVSIQTSKFSKKLHYVSIHGSHVSIHRGSWVFLKTSKNWIWVGGTVISP